MSLYIPGVSAADSFNRFDWDADDGIITSGNKPTVVAALFRLIPRNIAGFSGDVATTLAASDPAANGGIRLGTVPGIAGASALRLNCRTTLTNSHSSEPVPLVLDEEFYISARVDLINRQVRFYADGDQWGPTLTVTEGDTWRGSSFQPFLRGRGVDAKDVEWVEFAYWHNANNLSGNADSYVPTNAQLAAYTLGQSLSAWPAPKSRILPTGANGGFAATLDDLANEDRVFTQTSGSTSGIYAPYFVSAAELSAGSSVISSQAATFTYQNSATGTTHVLVGLASANPGAPTGAQIKAGQNQNGSSATVKQAFSDSDTGIKERQLTGLSRSTSYKAFAVVEKSTNMFSSVISWTFTTPRIGLRTQPIYTPGSTPALWASQTAIDVSVAAANMPSVIDTAETNSAGRLVVDLSEAAGFFMPVGGAAKIGWEKGANFGYQSALIENLDA